MMQKKKTKMQAANKDRPDATFKQRCVVASIYHPRSRFGVGISQQGA
jgi:hypothetical protein